MAGSEVVDDGNFLAIWVAGYIFEKVRDNNSNITWRYAAVVGL